jgi:cytochrome c peroxidase
MALSRSLPAVLLGLMAVNGAESQGISRAAAYQRVVELRELGRQLFLDPSLSGSGKLSCASCHDPKNAYGPPNALPVQLGGTDLRQPGLRAVPSLMYLQVAPQFTEHYFDEDDNGDGSVDAGPTGGLTWDGRVDRGKDQARMPLFSPYEMANGSPADVVARAEKSSYASRLRSLAGRSAHIFDTILEALETYQQDYREFFPYSSKYDAWLEGKAELTAQEQRGLSLFNRPDKGNCAVCHISQRGARGTPPQFTDYGFVALGAPRNQAIPANKDPNYYDLGLCGPARRDFLHVPDYCGLFRTPTLRNVATRKSFFHNGVFHSLKEVIEFYVERDTKPEKWPRRFDDLPVAFQGNVNTDPPFGRKPGDMPSLSDEEIQDVIAFLETLTDGYVSSNLGIEYKR